MAWLHRAGGDPTRLYYATHARDDDAHRRGARRGARAVRAGEGCLVDPGAGPAGVAIQLLGLLGAAVLAVMALKVTGETSWLYKGGFLLAGLATAGIVLSVVVVLPLLASPGRYSRRRGRTVPLGQK